MPARSPFSSSTTKILAFDLINAGLLPLERQTQGENRSATRCVGGLDRAAMRGNDLLRDPEAQTAPFWLGRKIGVEDRVQFAGSHTGSSVAHLHHGKTLRLTGADINPTAPAEGLKRIND